jgi:hypothetical protein
MATLTQIRVGNTSYDIDAGFETINITNSDTISDMSKLNHCYLQDNNYIYRLSYVDGNEYYFENIDETVYRYISIYSDGSIVRDTSKELATEHDIVDIINRKITVVINADDTIDLTIN